MLERSYSKGKYLPVFFYTLNMVRLYLKANIFMHIVLEKIFENKKINTYPKKPYDKPLYLIPSLKHQLIYLFKTWLYLLKKIVRRLQRKNYYGMLPINMLMIGKMFH